MVCCREKEDGWRGGDGGIYIGTSECVVEGSDGGCGVMEEDAKRWETTVMQDKVTKAKATLPPVSDRATITFTSSSMIVKAAKTNLDVAIQNPAQLDSHSRYRDFC